MTFAALQSMEQPCTETAFTSKEDPAQGIAQQLQELVKKLIEPIAPSSHGFSSSPTIKGKKYKEIKDEQGNYGMKTYAMYPTSIEDEKHKITILKAPLNDQMICTINSPYFENIPTIQSQTFDDSHDSNELLRELVTLLHQFQEQTNSLTEATSIAQYKVACKKNIADLIPSITGRIILPILSPELSSKTSPEGSPQSSPSPKNRKSLKKKLSQTLRELALNISKKP